MAGARDGKRAEALRNCQVFNQTRYEKQRATLRLGHFWPFRRRAAECSRPFTGTPIESTLREIPLALVVLPAVQPCVAINEEARP
jgi:hypothetical protein